jgi:hypothetical protein
VFDLRYHVASLLAVFLALIVGIVVGVGLSGRGLIEESERRNLNLRIDELKQQLEDARRRNDRERVAEAFAEEAYDAVINDRLRDQRIALVFVGSIDPQLNGPVEDALADAGARMVRLRAIDVPIDPEAIEAALAASPAVAGFAGEDRLQNLGEALGRELVAGGETPLWDALSGELLEERSGVASAPADAVVVMRSAPLQTGPTARFLHGLYTGLAASVPAVAAETSSTTPSAIPAYRRLQLSTVDNVDDPVGRVSLAVLLAGNARGHFGVRRETAESLVPPIEPVTVEAGD